MSNEGTATSAIVVVDDDSAVVTILQRVLRDLATNYTVLPVTGGNAALELFEQHRILLLITDYSMPKIDGLQLIRTVKERWPETKIVLMTAYDTPDLEKQAQAHHVDVYLPKPFTLDHLEQVVQSLIA